MHNRIMSEDDEFAALEGAPLGNTAEYWEWYEAQLEASGTHFPNDEIVAAIRLTRDAADRL